MRKPQYRSESAPPWHGHLVYGKRHDQRLEIDGFPHVDTWSTFVYFLFVCLFAIADTVLWLAGSGKSVLWYVLLQVPYSFLVH